MSLFEVASIIGFSIVFAAVLGLIIFRKIVPAYQPFIYIVWLGLFNHSLSLLMVRTTGSNAVNGNIFVLAEALLYVWFFSNMGLFSKKKLQTPILIGVLLTAWIFDNLIIHSLRTPNAGYRIVACFIMIFIAIEQLISLIATARKSLVRNSLFIICCGMLFYFSYKAFIEVFFLIEVSSGIKLITAIYSIFVVINCSVNLLFFFAVLWIPRKKQYLFSL